MSIAYAKIGTSTAGALVGATAGYTIASAGIALDNPPGEGVVDMPLGGALSTAIVLGGAASLGSYATGHWGNAGPLRSRMAAFAAVGLLAGVPAAAAREVFS